MKVIITGGGTAGHVTPLLAVVAELRKQSPGSDIRYIGQIGDPMTTLFADGVINKKYSIFAGKWRRYHGLSVLRHISDAKTMIKNMRDFLYFIVGFVQSFVIMLFWRPDVVFVKGGFVGLPVGLAAAVLKVPIITHDSDTVPGLTNRILSKYAKCNAVAMPKSYYNQYYSDQKMRYTGIPLRGEFYNHSSKQTKEFKTDLAIFDNAKIVTMFGGSLGAVRLNNTLLKNVDILLKDPNIILIWVTGKHQYEQISNSLKSAKYKDRIKLYAFANDVYKLLAVSDVVVSRAGATSIAELAELSKATILIPNPYLVGAHQTKNALVLSQANAVDVVFEEQLDSDSQILSTHILDILGNDNKQKQLSDNIHKLAISDSSIRIVRAILEVCR